MKTSLRDEVQLIVGQSRVHKLAVGASGHDLRHSMSVVYIMRTKRVNQTMKLSTVVKAVFSYHLCPWKYGSKGAD